MAAAVPLAVRCPFSVRPRRRALLNRRLRLLKHLLLSLPLRDPLVHNSLLPLQLAVGWAPWLGLRLAWDLLPWPRTWELVLSS